MTCKFSDRHGNVQKLEQTMYPKHPSNSQTHPILFVSEILSLIFQNSTTPILASLVLVNRVFNEIALPLLWQAQKGLVPLALCFGDAIEDIPPPGETDPPPPPTATYRLMEYNRKRTLVNRISSNFTA